jgi:glycosyltransferase involved in cell wall biosynthesis
MESLRIGIFSWESLYSVKVGGIAPHVSELSESIVKAGHEVHVFTRMGDRSSYDEINGVHYQRVDHNEFGRVTEQMEHMCNAMYDRFFAVEELFGKFDILHGHDWHPVRALNRLKMYNNRDYLLTYHSTEWGRNGNKHAGWPEAREISHWEWAGGYEAKEIIVTSQHLKNEIQSIYQIPESKINIIPNGIFPNKIKRDINLQEVKATLGIDASAHVVLFIGRMCHQKGVDMLVGAVPAVLSQHPDIHFVFIGEGEMRPHCQWLAHENGSAHACHFLGYAPSEVFFNWMNACDLVVVPSRNEPFGIVVLEAWDAEKPVIGTDAVQLINNFHDGIHADQTPESLAWCINYALGDITQTALMGTTGKKRLMKNYTWKKIAKDTCKAYKKLL